MFPAPHLLAFLLLFSQTPPPFRSFPQPPSSQQEFEKARQRAAEYEARDLDNRIRAFVKAFNLVIKDFMEGRFNPQNIKKANSAYERLKDHPLWNRPQ